MTANRTFEDPRKTDLRERVRVAVEASGMTLIEPPEKITPPGSANLKGYIIGDLQALDSENVVHSFYLQTRGDKAIPQWLTSIAIAAHGLDKVRVHAVVEESSTVLVRSCDAAGASLLELTTDGDYQLRTVVDGHSYSPEAKAAEFAARIRDLRRRIEVKMDANLDTLKAQHAKIIEHVRGMSAANQEKYVHASESLIRRWGDWGERLVRLLDEAASPPSEEKFLIALKEFEENAPA